MSRHDELTPDFFADVPRETARPHLRAARAASQRMLRAGHHATKRKLKDEIVAHLTALTRGEGRR